MRLSRRSFSLAAAAPFIVPAIVHGQGTPSSSRDFEPANDRLAGIFEYVPQTAVLGDTFGITWLDVERHQASVRERVEASTEEFTEDEIAFSSLYAAGSPLVQNAMALEDPQDSVLRASARQWSSENLRCGHVSEVGPAR